MSFEVPESVRATLAASEIELPTADEIEAAELERVRALRSVSELSPADSPNLVSDDGRDAPVRSQSVAGGKLICALCGAEIASLSSAYQLVTGWARPRAQGGTNALRLRRPLDKYACTLCVEHRHGQPHTQEALVG